MGDKILDHHYDNDNNNHGDNEIDFKTNPNEFMRFLVKPYPPNKKRGRNDLMNLRLTPETMIQSIRNNLWSKDCVLNIYMNYFNMDKEVNDSINWRYRYAELFLPNSLLIKCDPNNPVDLYYLKISTQIIFVT